MSDFWSGGASALIGGATSLGSALMGMYSAKQASGSQTEINEQMMDYGESQMDWQTEMYKTRHQKEVGDLRKAGLNPILSAKYGATGGYGPVGMPKLGNPSAVGAESAMSAMSAAGKAAGIGLTTAMTGTEVTKQVKNLADATKAGGEIKIPGLGTVPIDRAMEYLEKYWTTSGKGLNKMSPIFNMKGDNTQQRYIT